MTYQAASTDTHFKTSVMLANTLSRPLQTVHDDHFDGQGLSVEQLRALASRPEFEAPLNKGAADLLGLTDVPLDEEIFEKPGREDRTTVAIQLVVSPLEELQSLAQIIAAVQLHPQIIACVLKADRKQLQSLIGQSAYRIAVREASVFFPKLAERSAQSKLKTILPPRRADADADQPEPDASNPFFDLGFRTIRAFVSHIDSALGQLMRLRLPKPDARYPDVILSEPQCQEIVRLLRRKGGLG